MNKLHAPALAAALLATALPAAAQTPAAPPIRVVKGHFTMTDGEALYRNVCQACHMADAKGAVGAGSYPALASNPKLAETGYPVSVILHGQKAMLPLGALLTDQQVADVVNYIRANFGNRYKGAVTAADVKAAR